MGVRVRSEGASDVGAIEALTEAVFRDAAHSEHTEQFIINALREAGQLSISLVAEDNGAIVGHVAVSKANVTSLVDGMGRLCLV